MRIRLIAAAVSASAVFAFAAGQKSDSGQEATTKNYVRHTFGITSVGRAAAGAGVNQAMNTPSEWHQGAAGFGRRFASGFGKHIVKKTIEFPIAKWRHEPFFYRPSDKTGFRARAWYALSSVVITHRTTDGQPILHAAEISGAIGSGLVSRAWQPASTAAISSGFESGGLTLLADAGGNVLHEFWPEIRHPHSHAKARAEREEKLHAKEEAKVAAKARKREETPVEVDEQDREEN